MAYHWKAGDTEPELEFALSDAQGPIDLGNASEVRFHMRPAGGLGAVVDVACTVSDADAGEVRYLWSDGDLDLPAGDYEGEFQITFNSGNVLTVPNDGFVDIEITGEVA